MLEFSRIFRKDQDQKSGEIPKDKPKPNVDFSSLRFKESPEPAPVASSLNSEEQRDIQKLFNLDKKFLEAKELYVQGLRFVQTIVESASLPSEIDSVLGLVKKLIEFTKSSQQELIEVLLSSDYQENHYLILNMTNVCILSLHIGVDLNLPDDELITLGIAALFHDVGSISILETISQPRRLNKAEFEKVKRHPLESKQLLEQSGFKLLNDVVAAVYQEHERLDGSGYPQGLKSEAISLLAKIIGFADVYEALTHRRPWRSAHTPLQAMKIILNTKAAFDRVVVKTFLEKVGLCPRGSIIELSTKEVARILRHNPRYPMAPEIGIFYDSQKKKLKNPRHIDLSTKSTIHIARCL